MAKLWQRYGDAGVVAMIAHEMSHIATCALVQSGKVYQRDYELLADCLAGDYFGAYYPDNDMAAPSAMWSDLGDYEFNSWSHHGVPEQRYNAFLHGFQNRRNGEAEHAVEATMLCLVPLGYQFDL
jgi:hypothetical protein